MKCDVSCKYYHMCWCIGEGTCEIGEDCDHYKPEPPTVAFLCKDKGTEYCHHTKHIEQARNFEKVGPNQWMEKEPKHGKWIPLEYVDEEKVTHTSFPDELDGNWVLVTDGKSISIERIKKDIPDDHFSPAGRWFELNDVVAWMPLPEPYEKEGDDSDRA